VILEMIAVVSMSIWFIVDSIQNENKKVFSSDNFYIVLVMIIMVWIVYFAIDAVRKLFKVDLTLIR